MLFVGDDWSEDHHDIEVQDEAGRVLARARLPEGVAGIDRLHMMIAAHTGDDAVDLEATVGIETERGPWVQALLGSGYRVHAINPLRCRVIGRATPSPALRATPPMLTCWLR